MPFYLLAVGDAPSLRYGEGSNEREACKDAYGTVYLNDRMTAHKLPKSPKYMSQKALVAIQDQLVKLHKDKLDAQNNHQATEGTSSTNPG